MSLVDALRKRFPVNAYALMFEVRDRTGYLHGGTRRYADAIAVGLWPSRGIDVQGLEFKCHRGDWLKELENPAKADAIQRYCDRWWVLDQSGGAAVKLDEVPEAWGLLVLKNGSLRTEKPAPKLEAVPLDRGFAASMLRSSQEQREREYRRGHDAGYAEARDASAETTATMERLAAEASASLRELEELRRMREQVRAFEEGAGISIGGWQGRRVGEAFRAVQWVLSQPKPAEMARLMRQHAEELAAAYESLAALVVPPAEAENPGAAAR